MSTQQLHWDYFHSLKIFRVSYNQDGYLYYDIPTEIWYCVPTLFGDKKLLLPNTSKFTEEELFQATLYWDIEEIDFDKLYYLQTYFSKDLILSYHDDCIKKIKNRNSGYLIYKGKK